RREEELLVTIDRTVVLSHSPLSQKRQWTLLTNTPNQFGNRLREQMSDTGSEAGVHQMWLREYEMWCPVAPNLDVLRTRRGRCVIDSSTHS
ncbi:hypothetical protein, partial [Brevibacterium sp. FAM 24638]|uniref:hypothetical protein n=1 Tax=Brevibacterium sp. FAM 24638 TaxID=3415681 RepID=UPI003C7C87D8